MYSFRGGWTHTQHTHTHVCILHTVNTISCEHIGYSTISALMELSKYIHIASQAVIWFKTDNVFCLAEDTNHTFCLINKVVFLPEQ